MPASPCSDPRPAQQHEFRGPFGPAAQAMKDSANAQAAALTAQNILLERIAVALETLANRYVYASAQSDAVRYPAPKDAVMYHDSER